MVTKKILYEPVDASVAPLFGALPTFSEEREGEGGGGGAGGGADGGGDGDGDDARMLPVEVVGGDPMDWTTVTIHLDDLSICSEVGTDPDYVASLVAALRAC